LYSKFGKVKEPCKDGQINPEILKAYMESGGRKVRVQHASRQVGRVPKIIEKNFSKFDQTSQISKNAQDLLAPIEGDLSELKVDLSEFDSESIKAEIDFYEETRKSLKKELSVKLERFKFLISDDLKERLLETLNYDPFNKLQLYVNSLGESFDQFYQRIQGDWRDDIYALEDLQSSLRYFRNSELSSLANTLGKVKRIKRFSRSTPESFLSSLEPNLEKIEDLSSQALSYISDIEKIFKGIKDKCQPQEKGWWVIHRRAEIINEGGGLIVQHIFEPVEADSEQEARVLSEKGRKYWLNILEIDNKDSVMPNRSQKVFADVSAGPFKTAKEAREKAWALDKQNPAEYPRKKFWIFQVDITRDHKTRPIFYLPIAGYTKALAWEEMRSRIKDYEADSRDAFYKAKVIDGPFKSQYEAGAAADKYYKNR